MSLSSRGCRFLLVAILLITLQSVVASAPQNHKPVPHDGICEKANLTPHDFCYHIVDYPIASTLMKSRETVVSPRHVKEHKKIVEHNQVSVLSEKAAKEYDFYMNHHLDTSKAHENIRSIMYESDGNFQSGGQLDGEHAKCEALLKKYVCQNQFPRCYDDPAYVNPNEPVHLHVCYSLCHETAQVCGLQKRINCHLHHLDLNHEWKVPTDHQLRFDPQYISSDPYSEFWRIDCIESPPSSWKYLWHFLIYGGPGTVAAYTTTAILMYAVLAKVMGLSKDSPIATVAKLRQERLARRIAFENKMRKQQKKYVKLQEIKTVMLEQQEQEQATLAAATSGHSATSSTPPTTPQLHELQSLLRERAQKLAQLDGLLADLESEIQMDFMSMQAVLESEKKENEELGFSGAEGERLLAQAEAELDEQDTDGVDAGVKVFGQRRRRVPEPKEEDREFDPEEEEEEYVRPSPRKR